MGLIRATVLSVLGLLAAVLIPIATRLITDDLKEWLPWITRWLVKRAVRRLPEDQRERLEEEWWSHINDCPGDLAKIYVAYGYLAASKSINRIVQPADRLPVTKRMQWARFLDIIIASVLLSVELLSFSIIALLIRLDSLGPIFVRSHRVRKDGRKVTLIKFRTRDLSSSGTTRVGKCLKLLSLDELPQLINVLRGDMTLVGARRRPDHSDSGESM